MTPAEILAKINEDEDFVNLKRFDYSLQRVVARYPEGAPVKIIAQGLGLTEAEVEECYEKIVAKLRQVMRVEDEDEEDHD